MISFGVSVALLTPFNEAGEIDLPLLCQHANRMLAEGADSITLFGTSGEGASVHRSERSEGVKALLNSGCSANQLILGVCATSAGDAAEQVQEGVNLGVHRFLLLPPFYFKDCDDAGLFKWHQDLLAVTDEKARFILYHIPQVSGIALSYDLLQRLSEYAPDRIIAIKDSSGCWETAASLISQLSIPVLVGDERLLHRAVKHGAAGTISGMANLDPSRLQRIVQTATEDCALSEEVSRIVSV
ncbi:MAG: dihydrodipicolinate synthase family protein, partial [Granulosicoccus sp.]|nr:dihydrodipicolinate synthase family protein [Granulosicoccus sp.]